MGVDGVAPFIAAGLEESCIVPLVPEIVYGEIAGTDGPALDTGVCGQSRTGSLKCLHAHAGFALAHPEYELGRRILAELPQLWPDRCCTADE